MISVVVPAHNEEAIIGRCLSRLLEDGRAGDIEVIVACNGCTDATAERAAAFGPQVRVVETPIASKSAALDAGDEAARSFPRFYVDADIECSSEDLRRVAEVLESGAALAAAPRVRVRVAGRPWIIRQYFRAWTALPYVREGMVGSGVYGLSKEGRARFGRFDGIWADDFFVSSFFADHERSAVNGAWFTVNPPTDMRSLVRIRRRIYAYNIVDAVRFGRGQDELGARQRAGLRDLARHPRRWSALTVFVAVNVLAKMGARQKVRAGRVSTWERDETARALGS